MNSKAPEIVERFIELRAQGWTLDHISRELQVSKPTLIDWSRKHQHRLRNLRALYKEALADKLNLSSDHCLQQLGTLIQRLTQELEKRKLDDLPTHKLLSLLPALQAEALKLIGPLQLSATISADAPPEDLFPEPVVTWEI